MTGRIVALWAMVAMLRVTERSGLTLAQVRKLPAAVDVTTAAQALGVSRSSLYQAIAEGTAPVQVVTVGHRKKVITASLLGVLEGRGQPVSA
jgi:hypothetical protein